MSDNAFWCTMAGSLLTFILLLVVSLVAIDAYRDCRYIEAGYTHATVPGHDWPIWVKAGPASRTPPAVYDYSDIAVPITMPLCGKTEAAR